MAVFNMDDKIRDFMKERMDPDYGLLDVLRQGVLSREEIEEIQTEKTYRKRNLMILDYISKKNKLREFCAGLRNAHQPHIANYLLANGEYQPEFGAVWPLPDMQQSLLDANHGQLVELIDMSTELVRQLHSVNAISKRQMASMSSERRDNEEKTEILLLILERGSIEYYSKTIECLHNTKQERVATILSENLVVQRLHVEMSGSGDSTGETEDELAKEISDFIQGKRPDATYGAILRILSEASLLLLAAKKGNSIILYFGCKVLEDLLNLEDKLRSGDLTVLVENLYATLIPLPMNTKVRVRLYEADLKKAKAFLNAFI